MDAVIIFMAFCACLFLTSCSYVDEQEQTESLALVRMPSKSQIKISDIYQQFTPSLAQFQRIQKRPIPKRKYEQYLKLVKLKSESLKHKFKDAFLHSPSLIYKYSIPERKFNAKEEWLLGNEEQVKHYYRSFFASVYEHKIAYQLSPPPKANTETNSFIVFYFYKKRGVNQIYLIDPDIYRESILSQ